MQDFEEQLKAYSTTDIEKKRTWYSPAADAYDRVRPRYAKKIIDRAVELAHLTPEAKILEIGCGPGNATVAFARLGYSLVCLEPNPDFCRLAQINCQQYSQIEILQTSFEEWKLEVGKFDAVLAGTSIHWVSQEIVYSKAAEALKDSGYLILLWNTGPEPTWETWQLLKEVYQQFTPEFQAYEGRKTQQEHLEAFGQIVLRSGKFKDLVFELSIGELIYSTDDYLALLNTFSPYLKLPYQMRDDLFTGLRTKIDNKLGGKIELSYLSALQVAQKC
jgi:SAM-dependent methyltransferase